MEGETMGFFDSFRIHGGPTLYPSNKNPVTVDVTEWGFAFAIIIIIVSFIVILPGFRGRERWYFFIRATVGCFVLISIMVCNFGQEWEKAEVHNIRTYYKAGISSEIENATIQVKIGLRSVNITLKTDPVNYHINNKTKEVINYNERFHWNDFGWTQGRGGFGPFATLVNREYRDAQLKGSPFPILWVAEYFTIDGEGIRWGRFYRQAGYFTHALLWLALPLWIITIALFKLVLEFGAYFSMATGATLLLGNVIYATVRNPLNLQIHIGDEVLMFAWGWAFWLNLVNGLLALFIGIVVWFMNLRFTEAIFTFFGVDILTDIEEYYASIEELRQMGIHIAKPESPRKGHSNDGFNTDPGDVVINAREKDVELYDNVEGITRGFRRKNQGTFAKRFDRSIKAKSRNRGESRVDPSYYGGSSIHSLFQNPGIHHPHEAFVSHSEYSFRGGIIIPSRPPSLQSRQSRKRISPGPRFLAATKRGAFSRKRKNKKGRRPESDPGRLPFHIPGNIPVSYHSRYGGEGSMTSSTVYDSSESMLFPQGSRWRPPGSGNSISSSYMHIDSPRNSHPSHMRRPFNQQPLYLNSHRPTHGPNRLSDPTYPYKSHSSSESAHSYFEMQNERTRLYAQRNWLAPRNGMVHSGLPQNGLPQNGLPQNGLPQNGLPQNGIPHNGLPQNGLPHPVAPKRKMKQK